MLSLYTARLQWELQYYNVFNCLLFKCLNVYVLEATNLAYPFCTFSDWIQKSAQDDSSATQQRGGC